MGKRQSAMILVDEHERGAADRLGRGAEAGRNSTDQGGFPRSQRAVEREGFPSLQGPADRTTEPIRIDRRARGQITGGIQRRAGATRLQARSCPTRAARR